MQIAAARKTESEQLDLFSTPAPAAPAAGSTCRFDDIIGRGARMVDIFDLIERVADCDSTILINGETGTGKGLVARAIHMKSGRRAKPFIKVACAALPETLLESELFGHAKGAFTDGRHERAGLMVKAGVDAMKTEEHRLALNKLMSQMKSKYDKDTSGSKI